MSDEKFIPVAQPDLSGNELDYVTDAIQSSWISSSGHYLESFERRFATYCQVPEAIACSSGTTALHLALEALEIGPGDEVIVPTLTYVASVNAIAYTGAEPVLVDVEPGTWNLSSADVEACITPKTRAIVVVHLYGHPADLSAIHELAGRFNLYVIEDAAEALGATFRGYRIGSHSTVSAFSFYGNKVITTGEGGMITSHDAELVQRIRQLRAQGQDPKRRYWFPVRGFNYRMTNVQAAIGLAQLERLERALQIRQSIGDQYRRILREYEWARIQEPLPHATAVDWLFSLVVQGVSEDGRDAIMEHLEADGVETRPVFYPMHKLPVYKELDRKRGFATADEIAAGGLSLPTWVGLSDRQIERICDSLIAAASAHRR